MSRQLIQLEHARLERRITAILRDWGGALLSIAFARDYFGDALVDELLHRKLLVPCTHHPDDPTEKVFGDLAEVKSTNTTAD